MFLQIAFSFYIISAQCLMCELQAQVQLRTITVFHFEYVQIQTFRHSRRDIVLDLTKKPDSSKYRCMHIWTEHE